MAGADPAAVGPDRSGRFIDIDTASNTVSTRFYAPFTQTSFPEYGRTVFGMGWVG